MFLSRGVYVLESLHLVVTTLLGLVMAFRFAKRKAWLVIILVAGILVPILLLYLGEGAKRDLRSPETPPSVRSP